MKVLLVGGVRESALRAALASAAPGEHQLHDRNKLAWVALPDATEATLAAVQTALGDTLTIFEVDDKKAAKRTLPAQKPVDLSKTAKEILDSWGPIDPESGVTEADRARDVALALAEDIQPPPPPAAVPTGKGGGMPLKRKGTGGPREKPMHAVWAEALIDHLTRSEGLELHGDPPIGRVAGLLMKYDIDNALPADFGTTLLDFLVDDSSVEEVFVDEDALLAIARNTRPK
ncbi:MAG: hypothetical protein AB7T06_19745 [Kofleriaceae bacterium]